MNKHIIEHLKIQYSGIFLDNQIYDHIRNYIEDNQSRYLIKKIEPFLNPGYKILDIGSGYGSFVLGAIKAGYDCHGIEIESFEHSISKERATLANIDPSVFTQGSATSIPFQNDLFDIITFWNVLEHIDNYKCAILEAYRVLKPGGTMFIIAPNYFSFRKEAHYHLPWFPLFPKPLARIYLKLLNRRTDFLDNNIFYITSFGIKKMLKTLNSEINIDINEKISRNHKFKSNKFNTIIRICKTIGLLKMLMRILFFIRTHPLVSSIDVIIKK